MIARPEDGEITLAYLFDALRRQKRLAVGTFAALVLFAVAYLHIVDPTYTVSAVVSPPPDKSMSGAASRLGGIASLANIRIPAGESGERFQLYLEALYLRPAADLVARDEEIIKSLFPLEWDERAKAWREPKTVGRFIKTLIKTVIGAHVEPWAPPSGARLQTYLEKNLIQVASRNSSAVTLLIESEYPEQTRRLLGGLLSAADQILRQKAIVRHGEYIGYLEEKLRSVQVADYRIALVELLSQQEQSRMLASSTQGYAAEIFDAPVSSAKPTYPKAGLVLALSIVVGLIGGILLAVVRDMLAPSR